MRKFTLMISALLLGLTLAGCSDGEHGHEHGQDGEHSQNTPDHHNSIK